MHLYSQPLDSWRCVLGRGECALVLTATGQLEVCVGGESPELYSQFMKGHCVASGKPG